MALLRMSLSEGRSDVFATDADVVGVPAAEADSRGAAATAAATPATAVTANIVRRERWVSLMCAPDFREEGLCLRRGGRVPVRVAECVTGVWCHRDAASYVRRPGSFRVDADSDTGATPGIFRP